MCIFKKIEDKCQAFQRLSKAHERHVGFFNRNGFRNMQQKKILELRNFLDRSFENWQLVLNTNESHSVWALKSK